MAFSSRWTGALGLFAVLQAGPAWAQAVSNDWPMYGYSPSHTASNLAEHTLSDTNARQLRQHWATSIDGGAITGQAIVAGAIGTAGGVRDLAIVGTETGRIAALDAATGAVIWSHDTGFTTPGCGDLPKGQFGISATAIFVRSEGRVYAMGGDGKAYAYVVGTGAVIPGWPVTILPNAALEHVYGGLNVDNGGLFITTASMCDQNTYHGRVLRVRTASPPAITNVIYMDGTQTSGTTVTQYGSGGGGVWGPGGVAIDLTQSIHPLYIATGNLLHSAKESDFLGDHVAELTQDMTLMASDFPNVPSGDNDFGSTPVLYQMLSTCPASFAAINKARVVDIFSRNAIGSGPTQQIPNHSFVGDVSYDQARRQLIITDLDRIEAWRLAATGCQLVKAWSTPESSGPNGQLGQSISPPSEANRMVYYGNGAGNTFMALQASSGTTLFTATLGGSIYAAPTVTGGQVLVSSWDGKLYAFGL